mgnify:FL=1
MIIVTFNKPDFEYDVHSLLKEFFPKEDIQMYYREPANFSESKNLACTSHLITDDTEIDFEGASHRFEIRFIGGSDEDVEAKENEAHNTEADAGKAAGEHERIELLWSRGDEPASVYSFCETEGLDRKEKKNVLKQELYKMVSTGLGRELPWGTLSGIRPTKIAMKLLDEGATDDEVFRYMKDVYLASDEKAQLSVDIAKREKALLDKVDYDNGYSLYIGIPFCPSTCAYCSFTSYPLGVWRKSVDRYLDALEKEIDYTAQKFYHKKLNSIYIGGGTPTTLEPYQLDRLIRKIRCSFDLKECLEFTVEAGRPDSITREKLMALKKNGISRISVNPQTMKQETLDIIGRHHTVEDTIESFKLARELGFDNINMDLIMGLPEESIDDVKHTMEVIKELNPDNVTIHSLAIKRAARLTIFKDRYQDMQMVNTQEHMSVCEKYCKEIGLEPYYLYRQKGMAGNMENVGYAKAGKAGVYNILIMEEKQTIVACGAGASTKRVWAEPNPDGTHRIERCENVKDVGQYIDRIDEMIERKQKLFEETL